MHNSAKSKCGHNVSFSPAGGSSVLRQTGSTILIYYFVRRASYYGSVLETIDVEEKLFKGANGPFKQHAANLSPRVLTCAAIIRKNGRKGGSCLGFVFHVSCVTGGAMKLFGLILYEEKENDE